MKYLTIIYTLACAPCALADLSAEQRQQPLEAPSPDPKLGNIILIAGGPSGAAGNHEYFAGSVIIRDCLKQSPGNWPVLVADGWPKNEAILDSAKAIVIYADCGVKLPYLDPARFEKLGKLIAQGTGFVMLHQAGDVPITKAETTKSWLGAVWQADTGSRGHWDMDFKELPKHEINHGVEPFFAPFDGWLFNYHFAENVTPILTGTVPDKFRTTPDAKAHAGRAETFAWAYTRPDGGRSFGFSGCHLHTNWSIESQRRLVTNGILWAAKLPIPEKGAPVAMAPEALEKNLDSKAAAKAARK
jgi:hypothetical protein